MWPYSHFCASGVVWFIVSRWLLAGIPWPAHILPPQSPPIHFHKEAHNPTPPVWRSGSRFYLENILMLTQYIMPCHTDMSGVKRVERVWTWWPEQQPEWLLGSSSSLCLPSCHSSSSSSSLPAAAAEPHQQHQCRQPSLVWAHHS